MRFPRIFTEFDKERARKLLKERPDLNEREIIAEVIQLIREEIARGENPAYRARALKEVRAASAKAVAHRKTSEGQSAKTYWRRLPGSFGST